MCRVPGALEEQPPPRRRWTARDRRARDWPLTGPPGPRSRAARRTRSPALRTSEQVPVISCAARPSCRPGSHCESRPCLRRRCDIAPCCCRLPKACSRPRRLSLRCSRPAPPSAHVPRTRKSSTAPRLLPSDPPRAPARPEPRPVSSTLHDRPRFLATGPAVKMGAQSKPEISPWGRAAAGATGAVLANALVYPLDM